MMLRITNLRLCLALLTKEKSSDAGELGISAQLADHTHTGSDGFLDHVRIHDDGENGGGRKVSMSNVP